MQVRHRARQFGTHWPMLFTVGVAIYFLVSALDLGSKIDLPSLDNNPLHEQTSATTPITSSTTTISASSANAGDLRFSVKHVEVTPNVKHPGTIDARVTLDIRNNNGSSNITVRPEALKAKQGDTVVGATQSSAATISPHLAMIVPATFTLSANKGTAFELIYGDRSIYKGDLAEFR
jgi:hypothetical protein